MMATRSRHNAHKLASLTLTAVLLGTPLLASADGNMALKPFYDTKVYSSAYSNPNSTAYNPSSITPNTSTTYNNSSTYSSSSAYQQPYLQAHLVSIPKGTLMTVETDQPVSSLAMHVGDTINTTLTSDVFVNDRVAIRAGSTVLGHVTDVTPAGRLGKHGHLDIQFDSVKTKDGQTYPIAAHVVTKDNTGVLKGDTYAMDVAKGVGIAAGGAAAGTLMGTAAGSLLGAAGAGAVFGLGVGALGGMGYAAARKGKEVVIPSGSRISLKIDTPTSISGL